MELKQKLLIKKEYMEFPILNNNQVAIIIADGATGELLNIKGELFRNDSLDDNAYFVFENIDFAREFINSQSILNDKIEFVIYDKEQNVLDYIKATHWD